AHLPNREGGGLRAGTGREHLPPDQGDVHGTGCVVRQLDDSLLVGARGFEPLTSSVSGKRSPPELSARRSHHSKEWRGRRLVASSSRVLFVSYSPRDCKPESSSGL